MSAGAISGLTRPAPSPIVAPDPRAIVQGDSTMSKPFATRLRTAALGSLGLLLLAGSAVAADLRLVAGDVAVPVCDDAGVLDTVRSDFAYGMAHVEARALAIVEFGRIGSAGAGVDDPSHIAHRWCHAPVVLSDGRRSTAYWRIDRAMGFAAPGFADAPDGVESCVLGHDRWRVHDGACRTARRWW